MRAGAILLALFAGVFCLLVARAYWGVRPDIKTVDIPVPSIPAGTGPIKVVVLGTSLTANYDWADQLGDMFANCPSRDVAVSVVARPGATSHWGLEQVDKVVALAPEIVLIEFAVNDANIRRGILPGSSRTNHQSMLNALAEKRPEARIVLMTMNPVSSARGVLRPMIGRYYALYPDLAARNAVGFVNLTRHWADRPSPRADLPDGLHPGKDAAREVIPKALRGYFATTSCEDV
ncbi:SGNH/GDSL hydrolase family protein [Arenibacterium sp. CAU 1754]